MVLCWSSPTAQNEEETYGYGIVDPDVDGDLVLLGSGLEADDEWRRRDRLRQTDGFYARSSYVVRCFREEQDLKMRVD